jgi:hypothetical protein
MPGVGGRCEVPPAFHYGNIVYMEIAVNFPILRKKIKKVSFFEGNFVYL